MSLSLIPPTARCTNDRRTSSCSWSSLRSTSVSASSDPLTSALSTRFSVAVSPRSTIAKMSSRRAPPARIIGWSLRRDTSATRACLCDGPGDLLARCHAQLVACERDVIQSEDLDRRRRTGFLHLAAGVVEHGPDLAPAATGDHGVADAEGAALDEDGRDGTTALVEVRLEHERAGRGLGVRAEGRVVEIRDEQDRLEQLVDADPHARGDLVDDGVATPLLRDELLLDQLLAHTVGVHVVAVDLRDRHDDRHLGRTRVVDRLDRLRHHTVVGRDDEDRDIGRVGAALAHRGEGLVTRGVDEGDRALVRAPPGTRRCAG